MVRLKSILVSTVDLNLIITHVECFLVLGEDATRRLLRDVFEEFFDVGHLATLQLDTWSHESLKLFALDQDGDH